jgi:hypothetical protein
MRRHQISNLGRWALAAVASNIALVAGLGALLPHETQGILPLFALGLPLLTAATLEGLVQRLSEARSPGRQVERSRTEDGVVARTLAA